MGGLLTWNIEHIPGNWTYLPGLTNSIDSVCIQETGNGFKSQRWWPDTPTVYQFEDNTIYITDIPIGSSTRGDVWRCVIAGFGTNETNSLGLLIKSEARHMPSVDLIPSENERRRPLIGMLRDDGVWLYCIHAPASRGSPSHLAYIKEMLAEVARKRTYQSWICAGDYNVSPDDTEKLKPERSSICRPNAPTHNKGGEFDYVVTSPELFKKANVTWIGSSDHKPVQYF